MIGIDSNLLLRLVLNDDEVQCSRIRRLLASQASTVGAVRISDMVLCETVWTLGKAFRYPRTAISRLVEGLLAEPGFSFASREGVAAALDRFRISKAGFADCLIAVDNEYAGCVYTATFDADAARAPGMKAVP